MLFALAPIAAEGPPNIVLIVADDLGAHDLGYSGSDGHFTPHIDALAKQSLSVRRAYSMPNCAPARATFLTGRMPDRHGIYTVGSGARGRAEDRAWTPAPNKTELPPEEWTLAEQLQTAGYQTGFVGKWHLGEGAAGPKAQGYQWSAAGGPAGHPTSYFSPYSLPDLADGPAGEHLTARIGAEASRFIGRQSSSQPFFLTVSFYAVHTPIQPSEESKAAWADRALGQRHNSRSYAALVSDLDNAVGQVMKAIDDRRLAENTLVIFTSDNGGFGGYASSGLAPYGPTDNAPLKGGKGQLFEGGIRVPFLVRWPGRSPAGRTIEGPLHLVDLFATLSSAANSPIKAGAEDSTSRTALFKGIQDDPPDYVWNFPGYLEATNRTFRLTPSAAIISNSRKLIRFEGEPRPLVYNLAEDPQEAHPLPPDPELEARLDARLTATKAPRAQKGTQS
jgi:arylsulfatase A-like enzyme